MALYGYGLYDYDTKAPVLMRAHAHGRMCRHAQSYARVRAFMDAHKCTCTQVMSVKKNSGPT